MLTKLATFSGVQPDGEPAVRLFRQGSSITKTAGDFMPRVREWLDNYKSDRNYIAVLVNALGGSEYWGQNNNGDVFPWSALAHDCSKSCVSKHPIDNFTGRITPPYGYQTFLEAHPFAHHCNKDPSRAFGNVALSCLNPKMKRVELVVIIDREKAAKFGGQHAVERIDAGEFPDVSMGCFRAGTSILMGDGTTKAIEEVREGDEVFTHLGRSRLVTNTMVREHERIFRFKAYGHEEQWVTEEHPLWLARKDDFACRPSSSSVNKGRKQQVCSPDSAQTKKGCAGCTTTPHPEFSWVPVAEAQEGDYVAAPVPQFPLPERILTRAEARLVGYYLAEGHLLHSKAGKLRGVQFSTGLDESRNHSDIYEMAIELGLEENISDYDVSERNGKYISIWGAPELAALCEKLCGSGAHEKTLHPELLGQPKEVLLEFLGAYTNGDGGTYKGSVYFSTCSESLAHQLGLVAMLCDLIPSHNIIVHKPSTVVAKETVEHQVWIGTDTSWKLSTTWKPTRKSKRLNNKRFFYENGGATWLLTTIEALEEHETSEPVYNFSVEGHESYIAGGIAVHNCRVPYDVCTICGHKSKTQRDYCDHVKVIGMNKILDDGRKVGVINLHPRFFDISFVFVGADRTAKTMAKLASSGLHVPQSVADAIQLYGDQNDAEGLVKAASEKNASVSGVARKVLSWAPTLSGAAAGGYAGGQIGKENSDSPFSATGAVLGAAAGAGLGGLASKNRSLRYDEGLAKRLADHESRLRRKLLRINDKPKVKARLSRMGEKMTNNFTTKRNVSQMGDDLKSSALLGGIGAASGIGSNVVQGVMDREKKANWGFKAARGLRKAQEYSLPGDFYVYNPFKEEKKQNPVPQQTPVSQFPKIASEYQKPPHRDDFPYAGKRKWRGLTILVENPAGTWRRGKNWATKMKNDYGEIEGSLGTDGDPVDVYVGPHESSDRVFIVHQNHVMGPKKGEYDEDKIMLGFRTSDEAKKAYLRHYDRPDFFRSITEMDFEPFKKMIFRKDSQGEKIAQKIKTAASMELEDLFTNHETARKRSRAWSSDGKTATHIGPGFTKEAASKMALDKKADIDKIIEPNGVVGIVTKVLNLREPQLPSEVIRDLSREEFSRAIATPSAMGMVLKPEEFQSIMLRSTGHEDLADRCDARHVVFPPSSDIHDLGEINPATDVDPKLIERLLPLLEGRSYLRPVLARRVSNLAKTPVIDPNKEPEKEPETNEEKMLLSKVGAAYNWYRNQMAKVALNGSDLAMDRSPLLKAAVYGSSDEGIFFQKEANAGLAQFGAVATTVPLVLMLSSSARRDLENGKDVGLLRRLIADHPYLAALGTSALTRTVVKDPQVTRIINDIAGAASRFKVRA